MTSSAKKLLAPSLAALLTCTSGVVLSAPPQTSAVAASSQLAPMLAPVALYPDALLAQVLTASQFPDQIAAAAAWQKANPKISGSAAARATAGKRWNASVVSLLNFPDLLASMASRTDWVRTLGQTYASRPADVMASVQQLRQQADKAGTLRDGPQQKVVITGPYISIQPVDPAVVYIPMYDPAVVYGSWAYPAMPAVVLPVTRPGAVVSAGIIGFGLAVALSNQRWGVIDWGSNRTVVSNYYTDNSVYVSNASVTQNTVNVTTGSSTVQSTEVSSVGTIHRPEEVSTVQDDAGFSGVGTIHRPEEVSTVQDDAGFSGVGTIHHAEETPDDAASEHANEQVEYSGTVHEAEEEPLQPEDTGSDDGAGNYGDDTDNDSDYAYSANDGGGEYSSDDSSDFGGGDFGGGGGDYSGGGDDE